LSSRLVGALVESGKNIVRMAGEELALLLGAGLAGESAVSDRLSEGLSFTLNESTLVLGARLAGEAAVGDSFSNGLCLTLLGAGLTWEAAVRLGLRVGDGDGLSDGLTLLGAGLAWEAAVRVGLWDWRWDSITLGAWLAREAAVRIRESGTIGDGRHDSSSDDCGDLHIDGRKILVE